MGLLFSKRREFLLAGLLLGLTSLPLVRRFAIKKFVLIVDIKIPENMSVRTFFSSRRNWMKLDEFDQLKKSFLASGRMTNNEIKALEDKVRFKYFFKTKEDLIAFHRSVDELNVVNKTQRVSIGLLAREQALIIES